MIFRKKDSNGNDLKEYNLTPLTISLWLLKYLLFCGAVCLVVASVGGIVLASKWIWHFIMLLAP